MLTDNTDTKTHGKVIDSSITDLVGQGSHFGVEETTFGEEELVCIVHADIHAGLWTRGE